jgi:hypothetical protein
MAVFAGVAASKLAETLGFASRTRARRENSRYGSAMHLDLSDEEAAALTQELHDIVESDRSPSSPRIQTLRAIPVKLRPEPVREPLPPRKVY